MATQTVTQTVQVRIDRTRMAMDGCFYSYDGLVSTDQLDRSRHSYFIVMDGVEYVSFANATQPAAVDAMPKGWERYQASCEHRGRALARLLEIAKTVYPELAPVSDWPTLWLEVPNADLPHASTYVTEAF